MILPCLCCSFSFHCLRFSVWVRFFLLTLHGSRMPPLTVTLRLWLQKTKWGVWEPKNSRKHSTTQVMENFKGCLERRWKYAWRVARIMLVCVWIWECFSVALNRFRQTPTTKHSACQTDFLDFYHQIWQCVESRLTCI